MSSGGETLFYPGAILEVPSLLDRFRPKSIFLVTGKRSYAACGAESALRSTLRDRRVVHFDDAAPNPKLQDVERASALMRSERCDLVLAVGGGSVLDLAKLAGAFSAQDRSPLEIIEGAATVENPGPPLIAVPTTAGSGSEATHFAVVYVGHRKYSVASPILLPTVAVVDPELTYGLSPELTAVTGLDALSQGIESLWSVDATESSGRDAEESARLALEALSDAVRRPTAEARRTMCRAAHLAGKAINITRTTAPHAISYTMTSHFGVPHGHAVVLTLGPILLYNSEVRDDDAADPRGACAVREKIRRVNGLLGAETAEAACRKLTRLIESLGLATRLGAVGIRSDADRALLVENVNAERLRGNPRTLTSAALRQLLETIA